MYYSGQLTLSKEQAEHLKRYLSLTEKNTQRATDPYWQTHYTGILEAFGNDPERAAAAFHAARKKGQDAMVAHYHKRMQEAPYPDRKNPFLRFDTIPQAEAHYKEVKKESVQLSHDVFCAEFYDVVEAYHKGQWQKPVSVQ